MTNKHNDPSSEKHLFKILKGFSKDSFNARLKEEISSKKSKVVDNKTLEESMKTFTSNLPNFDFCLSQSEALNKNLIEEVNNKYVSDISREETEMKTLYDDNNNVDEFEEKINRDEMESEKGDKEKMFDGDNKITHGLKSEKGDQEKMFTDDNEGMGQWGASEGNNILSEIHYQPYLVSLEMNSREINETLIDRQQGQTIQDNLCCQSTFKQTYNSKKICYTQKFNLPLDALPGEKKSNMSIVEDYNFKQKKTGRYLKNKKGLITRNLSAVSAFGKGDADTYHGRDIQTKHKHSFKRHRTYKQGLYFQREKEAANKRNKDDGRPKNKRQGNNWMKYFWLMRKPVTSTQVHEHWKSNRKHESYQFLQCYKKKERKNYCGEDLLKITFRTRGHADSNNGSNRRSAGHFNNTTFPSRSSQGAAGSSSGMERGASGGNSGDDGDDENHPRRPGVSRPLPQSPLSVLLSDERALPAELYQQFSGAENNIHGALAVNQFCDALGIATNRVPEASEIPPQLNICLTKAMHDLSYTTSNDGEALKDCTICTIMSCLLKHLAALSHSAGETCDPCLQIFHLIIWHVHTCLGDGQQRAKVSRFDLCYKICKESDWSRDKVFSTMMKLKAKIKKYCTKVLGTSSSEMDEAFGMESVGMCETMGDPAILRTISNTSNSSLSGNPVTQETERPPESAQGYLAQYAVIAPHDAGYHSSQAEGFNPPISPPNTAQQQETSSPSCVPKLVRKPSTRSWSKMPQTITEESQEDEISKSLFGATDMERLLHKQTSPYDTQPTYGHQHTYVSMPSSNNVHDNEQFMSNTASNRPAVAGVGSVVYGLSSQLRKVASHWTNIQAECIKNQYCLNQPREEGVILADYKEHFFLLKQRYQKHQQWQRLTHLGNGMSGKCHLAMDIRTSFRFCCKKIHLLRYSEEELSIWTGINHDSIVKLYGAIRHGFKIYIFSEFIDGGDLAACIAEQKALGRRLSHWSAINYFKQLLNVLTYLKSQNILHEDIKADNILLRRNTTFIAVTDFGTSRKLHDPKELKNKEPLGSPTHWSPEKASMSGHGFPSDLWAAVCVLVHMLSGSPPWLKRFNKAGILNYIIYAHPPPMDDVPQNVRENVRLLIEKGFVKDPQLRPSSDQLLQDPAFRILDDERQSEVYYSNLVSHSGRNIQRPGEAAEDNYDQMRLLSTTALNIISDKTVLYEQHISTVTPPAAEPPAIEPQAVSPAPETELPLDTASVSLQSQPNILPIESTIHQVPLELFNEEETSISNNEDSAINTIRSYPLANSTVDPRILGLIEPTDINTLLPEFALIYPSDGSENSQSIQSFFVDNLRQNVKFEKTELPLYQPAEKDSKQLPNLSIFDASIHNSTPQVSDAEQCQAIGTAQGADYKRTSPVLFTFSSDSNCSSSELFASGTPGDQQVVGGDACQANQAISSPSNSSLMQRKKENLKLNLNNPTQLEHSLSETLPQANSGLEHKNDKRSNTWTKLSTFTPRPSQQPTPNITPPTRQGTSSSTTGSSTQSFFPSPQTVQELQDNAYQNMMEILHKNESDIIEDEDNESNRLRATTPYQDASKENDIFKKLVDSSILDGFKLEFLNSVQEKLFDIRVHEDEVHLKHIIDTVRHKMAPCDHFIIRQMDGALLKPSKSLTQKKYQIILLQKSDNNCLCGRCSYIHSP